MTTSHRIPASRVLTSDGWLDDAVVVIDTARGTVESVEPAVGAVPDRIVAPGFVDLQVNGIDDVDCSTARGAEWDRLDELLLRQGVTTWCPTLITMPLDRIDAALARIRAAIDRPTSTRPTIAGAHLEGPFLGGAPGAHRRDLVLPIDLGWLDRLPDHVAMVTLAAEQPDAVPAIAALRARGVLVSIGHTTASHDQVLAAFDSGASMATHLFNGMSGVHHREPGVATSVLTHPSAAASLIADGVHVHPLVLRLAAGILGPDRTVLVTDAVGWRSGSVGPVGIGIRDGAPRLPDGTLAGSAVTMDAAVRTMIDAGVGSEHALRAASTVPARLLGLPDRGVIAPGRRADLVVLSSDVRVEATVVGGSVVQY